MVVTLSYLGDLGLKGRSPRPAILIEIFRDFPQSLQVNAGILT
jgi:hypothetical protein